MVLATPFRLFTTNWDPTNSLAIVIAFLLVTDVDLIKVWGLNRLNQVNDQYDYVVLN